MNHTCSIPLARIALGVFMIVAALAISGSVSAGSYTANHTSQVKWVKLYNADHFYFGLASMPADHQCGSGGLFFVVPSTISEAARQRYFEMLMTALKDKSKVAVGYDNQAGDCFFGRPIVQALSIE